MKDIISSKRFAFTLIEMSIVLVILSLIIGGIIVGQDLIKSAAIRAQISQFGKFDQSVNTFRNKYDCIPGDCANASSFLPNLPQYYQNGNGDGWFEDMHWCCYLNTSGNPDSVESEPTAFWMHLYAAGLTECCDPSNPPSTNGGSIGTYTIGKAFPQDKMNGYGIGVGTMGGKNGYFWGINHNASGTFASGYGSLYSIAGVITPKEAKYIDDKVDDGQATTGNIYSAWVWGGNGYV